MNLFYIAPKFNAPYYFCTHSFNSYLISNYSAGSDLSFSNTFCAMTKRCAGRLMDGESHSNPVTVNIKSQVLMWNTICSKCFFIKTNFYTKLSVNKGSILCYRTCYLPQNSNALWLRQQFLPLLFTSRGSETKESCFCLT